MGHPRWWLAADEAGVEGAGEAGVGGALDEGAAVGEDGEGVGGVGEAEEEAVGSYVPRGLRRDSSSVEVEGVVVLVDLHGVAAAEGDVRALVSGEVAEDALVADFAVCAGGGGVDFGAGGWPEVEGEQGAAHEVGLVGEVLEGFGDLEGGGEVDGGGEDAGGVAGVDVAGGGGGEDAGEAGCRMQGPGPRAQGSESEGSGSRVQGPGKRWRGRDCANPPSTTIGPSSKMGHPGVGAWVEAFWALSLDAGPSPLGRMFMVAA